MSILIPISITNLLRHNGQIKEMFLVFKFTGAKVFRLL